MRAHLSFPHIFEPAVNAPPPILLLHGAGGNETDLLPFGRAISPESALLSPRGLVIENGLPRFFGSLPGKEFDEKDVRVRAGELAQFIADARRTYRLMAPMAVGFSNGANIAAAILLLHPKCLAGAILIRAAAPLSVKRGGALSGKPVLVISGIDDPIAPCEKAARLVAMLAARDAEVRHEIIAASHGMAQQDILLAAAFFDAMRRRASRSGAAHRKKRESLLSS
jgi:phospholipase/carboxylesterase